VYAVFRFLVFNCQYQCSLLLGKTHLRNVTSGPLNPALSLTTALQMYNNDFRYSSLSRLTICCKRLSISYVSDFVEHKQICLVFALY